VIAASTREQSEHPVQALERRGASDPTAFCGYDQRHDSEARAADRDRIRVVCALTRRASVERQTADGMRALPKITERLALHCLEQYVVRQRGEAQGVLRGRCARAFGGRRDAS
jgi:hypothetical protein